MKKSVIAVFAGLVSAVAFAGMDNVLVSFSSQGPDTYKDGTPVIDGECYALVWTPAGSTFAGINADGSAAGDSKVAIAAPVAKDGKCPPITFQIDEEYARTNFRGGVGTWGVYLLDTRRYPTVKDAEGNDIVDTTAKPTVGDDSIVNGYGAVTTLSGSKMVSGSTDGAVAVSTSSESPASASNLKVNDIKFVGNNVYIYVTGSLSCLQYELKSGDSVDGLAAPADGKAQYGNDNGEMIIITPKKPGAQFFRVNRK